MADGNEKRPSDEEMPVVEDGMSEMDVGAVGLQEAYQTFLKAGFAPMEALWLIGCMLRGVPLPEWLIDRLGEGG